MKHTKYVDVSYCPLATTDRMDFFANLTIVKDEKLIFIPVNFLDRKKDSKAPGWHTIITTLCVVNLLTKSIVSTMPLSRS